MQKIVKLDNIASDNIGAVTGTRIQRVANLTHNHELQGMNPEIFDSNIYNFRKIANGADAGVCGGSKLRDKIIGGTVAWNQLVQNGNFANGITSWHRNSSRFSYSVSNGILEISTRGVTLSIATPILTPNNDSDNDQVIGHKYLITMDYKIPTTNTTLTTIKTGLRGMTNTLLITTDTFLNKSIIQQSSEARGILAFVPVANITPDTDEKIYLKNVQVFDLTQTFGTTIANYIYSLEQANAGAGVAWFKQYFPKQYYTYQSGSLESVNISAHAFSEINQHNPLTQINNKGLSWTVAEEFNDSGSVVSDYIRATNSTYYTNYNAACFGYDSGKNYIGVLKNGAWVTSTGDMVKQHNVSGVYYIRFWFRASGNDGIDLTTQDLSVSFSPRVLQGEFTRYREYSYLYRLDNQLQLRGIPKIDGNGKLYYDGDIYESSGKVTRRYGIVDLGTLNYEYNVNYGAFKSTNITDAKYHSGSVIENLICSKGYIPCGSMTAQRPDKTITLNASSHALNTLFIKDSAYGTDAAAFKTAMFGVYLVYELATPTEETFTPYVNPQTFKPYTIESYIDYAVAQGSRDVEIPVYHETYYEI